MCCFGSRQLVPVDELNHHWQLLLSAGLVAGLHKILVLRGDLHIAAVHVGKVRDEHVLAVI